MLEAVVDLGYNSFQLCIYDHYKSNSFKLLSRYKSFVRLGTDLSEGEDIKTKKIKDGSYEITKYREIIDELNIKKVHAVGTSAFRMASNQKDVADKFSGILGHKVDIISGYREGEYSVTGSLNTLPFRDALIFDLGGGSLEIAVVRDRKIEKINNYNLGALKLLHESKTEKEIRSRIDEEVLEFKNINLPVIGSGGNLRALAKYDEKTVKYPLSSLHGYKLSRSSISNYAKKLPQIKPSERSKYPGISKERSYTIGVASIIIDELMGIFNSGFLYVSLFGMREGVLMEDLYDNINDLRRSWLEAYSNKFDAIPPWDYYNYAIEKLHADDAKKEMCGNAAFMSRIMAYATYKSPLYACGFTLKNAINPGFTAAEIVDMAAVCYSGSGKPKKNIEKVSTLSPKEIKEMGKLVKDTIYKKRFLI